MNRSIVASLLMLFFLPVQSADITQSAIETQQSDQELCVQQLVNQCIDKCKNAGDNNCVQLCQENAKHECRQAGE